jgi:excisionase family DNA binding protein
MTAQNLVFSPIPLDELTAVITQTVRSEMERAAQCFTPPPSTELITRKEAAQILGVSLVTLNDWTKAGTITGYRIGTRIRYKRHELEDAVREIRSLKYKRRV